MSEDPSSRISFRKDKVSENLKLQKNKFGHTVSFNEETEAMPQVDLEIGGTGVIAHVDIFESPHLKKFMNDSNLSIENEHDSDETIDLTEDIHIDLSDEFDYKPNLRPDTLEEFDYLADHLMSDKFTKDNKKQLFQKTQNSDSKTKVCHNCNSRIKQESKYCSNCGTTQQIMAKFCKNCGNRYDGSEKFCSECGSKRE